MILNDFLDAVKLVVCESTAALEADRVEPELRLRTAVFDMNVRRFAPIARIKEKPIRTVRGMVGIKSC